MSDRQHLPEARAQHKRAAAPPFTALAKVLRAPPPPPAPAPAQVLDFTRTARVGGGGAPFLREHTRNLSGRIDAWAGDRGTATGTSEPDTTEPRGPAAPLADVHVLVVDEDADSRQIFQAALAYGGAVVSVACTARDALGVLERVRADVVLMDVALPGEDGYWLVQQLRGWPAERGGRVPVVAITSADDPRDKILAAGFTEHLRKPIMVDRLHRVIGALIARPRRA